jgi:ABC transporter DrrB family efflux protein
LITDTTVLAPELRPSPAQEGGSLAWVVADALTVTKRNLIAFTRIPEFLFFNGVQPIMFVLLFRYVFGGAISISGPLAVYLKHHYVNYLMPGIFVQTVGFGAISTSIGLAEDLQKGLIERFRALPMARSAVLAGRTMADFVRNIFVFILMVAVGYAVGFRVQTNLGGFLGAAALVLAFAFTLSWGFASIGLSAPNSETAQVMSFPILFPLIFASPAFVPVQDMPGWLQAFATRQPFGPVVEATRALMFGGPTATYVEQAVAWCAGLLVVLVPLAVWRYRRAG